MADNPKKTFVCGHPVAHSRSPLIHGHWLAELGIDGSYEAMDVPSQDFPDFIASIAKRGFIGGNVTIPHKEAAWAGVDRRDAAAEAIGAVNTVWIENGKTHGSNTDGYGFAANLDDFASGWDDADSALVLGAGGASRAIVFALLQRGFRNVRIVNRTVSRAGELAERFGPRVMAHGWDEASELLGNTDLLVNTTSLGMSDAGAADLDIAALPDHAIVTDIVYVPLETMLLKSARERGLTTVDGLGMLLHQAVPGFQRWFGTRPTVSTELRAKIVADLERGK